MLIIEVFRLREEGLPSDGQNITFLSPSKGEKVACGEKTPVFSKMFSLCLHVNCTYKMLIVEIFKQDSDQNTAFLSSSK